jgi:hypothetical protein
MSAARDHDLLDGPLDEVLAGRTPPDLTARIMQAYAMRRPVDLSVLPPALPGPPPIAIGVGRPGAALAGLGAALHDAVPQNGQAVVELPASVEVQAGRKPGRRRNSNANNSWAGRGLAVGLLSAALAVGLSIYLRGGLGGPDQPQIAEHHGTPNNEPNKIGPAVSPDRVAKSSDGIANIATPGLGGRADEQASVDPSLPAAVDLAGTSPTEATGPLVAPPSYGDPSPNQEVVSFVNAELSQSWTENGVAPAPLATDKEWCRRLFLRVLGRIPTVEELSAFSSDRSPDKREKLVDRLLTDDDYVAEYARHWSTIWANVLIGRTGGESTSLASREGLEQYLGQALAKNKPYHEWVHELLVATGSSEPGTEGYNGAVNFLLAGMNQDATLATSRVSRVFLGHQLQCAQCHNHPTQDWTQENFWGLNAFFRKLHVERSGSAVVLTNASGVRGEPGKGSTEGRDSNEDNVFYETPTGLLKTAVPAFLDGTQLSAEFDASGVDRRVALARYVLASKQMPRALVNRMWSHFFGYGFTQPVDDMPPEGAGSHPELLDRLAEEFAAHHYDLKHLIRWIALSDAFGRSSQLVTLRSKDLPEAGETPLFSRYYTRQLGIEEAYNSLVQAARIRKTAANESEVEKARIDWLAQFNRPMGTDDAEEESHFSGGIGQSLAMMNGDLMRRAVSTQQAGLLKELAASKLSYDGKVKHLFLSALSREATRRELDAARQILTNSSGNESIAIEDVWWALLNSNEFILDH